MLLNTDVYDEAPAVLEAARRAGAEIVGHGRSNSDSLSRMTPDAERAYLDDVADRIRAARGCGTRAAGPAPGSATPRRRLNLLADTGYRYLLDLRLDDQPVWLTTESGPLLAIPYNAEINDSSTMIGRQASAHEFEDDDRRRVHRTARRGRAAPLVMSIVLHSFITGVPFRLRAVARALERIAAADGVWLTTPREIHRAVVRFARAVPPPVAEVTS